jgi:hypothetical protein
VADQRTLRSKRLRAALWMAADGKCQICGCELDPKDWHADHIKPWSVTHRTNPYEMQATCPECNREKGAKYMNRQIKRFILRQIKKSAMRPGQIGAFDYVIQALIDGVDILSISLPMRYGKSDLMRVIASAAKAMGLADYSLVLSPSDILREQMGCQGRWANAIRRYSLPPEIEPWIQKDFPLPNTNFGNRTFLSATIQAFETSKPHWILWIKSIVDAGGRIIIFVDEVHMADESNAWGKAIKEAMDAGATIITLTGTGGMRANGGVSPGWFIEGEEQVKNTVHKTPVPGAEDPQKQRWHKYTTETKTRKLCAHYTYTDKEAYAEDNCPIAKMNHIVIDVDMTERVDPEDATGTRLMLSELSENKVRKYLGIALKDDVVFESLLGEGVRDLRLMKRIDPRFQMLVFVGNDYKASETDQAAKRAKKILKKIGHDLKCVIVTMASGANADAVRQFAGSLGDPNDTERDPYIPPDGDIIIVKQMAALGVDFPFAKDVVDLSPNRQIASSLQKWRRASMPNIIPIYCVFTLADCLSKEISKIGTDGSAGESSISTSELLEIFETNKEESERPVVTVNGTMSGGSSDNFGAQADPRWTEMAREYFEKFPDKKGTHTVPEMALKLQKALDHNANETPTEPAPPIQTSVPVSPKKALSNEMRTLAERYRDLFYQNSWKDEEESTAVGQMVSIYEKAKKEARIPVDASTGKPRSSTKFGPGDYQAMIDALKKMTSDLKAKRKEVKEREFLESERERITKEASGNNGMLEW